MRLRSSCKNAFCQFFWQEKNLEVLLFICFVRRTSRRATDFTMTFVNVKSPRARLRSAFKLITGPFTLDKSQSMDQLIQTVTMTSADSLKLGQLVDAVVIDKGENHILVEVLGAFTGIIAGKELQDIEGTAAGLAIGDTVAVVVIGLEDENGQYTLSLRRAGHIRAWDRFTEMFEQGTIVKVRPEEANKGGLLFELAGIKGFIPVSQLAPVHYPRVNNANGDDIVRKLTPLLGKEFEVRIITMDKEQNKIVFSERKAQEEMRSEALAGLKVGEKVSGHVSSIVDFGFFVTFNGIEGLVHISEIAWNKVTNPYLHVKVGDSIDVMVIGVEGPKISFSLKRLLPDPWVEAAKHLQVGDVVKGEISRFTTFGAFLKLNDVVDGLIHLSEISAKPVRNAAEALKVGQICEAQVISLDLPNHRLGLSLKALEKPATAA